MARATVAFLLFGLAVASASQVDDKININWPDRPSWWPGILPWPPAIPDQWPDAPSIWPDHLPWPPAKPEQWPERPPALWPDILPWPPALPNEWPDRPSWWPGSLPWPPALPDAWPDKPSFWPEHLPWPPAKPEEWPDRPPALWPDFLPWPPALPEEWPEEPSWWPDSLPWPPALPEQWPEQPSWWPENFPWPPSISDIPWPPPGVDIDRLPYVPSRDNQFHLFTRNNPYMSQPIVFRNYDVLWRTNYRASRPTIVLLHDIYGSATDPFNAILVPACLAAGDVNVIVVDWSAGAWSSTALSVFYSGLSANFNARFLNWLNVATAGDFSQFHLVGVGLGGWNAGVLGLRLRRQAGFITALDPSKGSRITNLIPALTLRVAGDVRVIHTDADQGGYRNPLGHMDFYPNGGKYQPGCGGDSGCNRNRAIYFFAESIQTGGFTGHRCDNWREVFTGNCFGERASIGGLTPERGAPGTYYVRTNAVPPFSQG